jgi:hypothetical protein
MTAAKPSTRLTSNASALGTPKAARPMSIEIATVRPGPAELGIPSPQSFVEGLSTLVRSWTTSSAPPTISHVLSAWREAERDLDAETPGSAAWNSASERFLLARSEYHRMFAQAVADGEADNLRVP